MVSVLCASGITQEIIANVLKISRVTLEKHYRKELDMAGQDAVARVAGTLYKMAVSGDCPAATFFFLKTRGGWREKGEDDPQRWEGKIVITSEDAKL